MLLVIKKRLFRKIKKIIKVLEKNEDTPSDQVKLFREIETKLDKLDRLNIYNLRLIVNLESWEDKAWKILSSNIPRNTLEKLYPECIDHRRISLKIKEIPEHEFIIDWDASNRKEIERAKLLYQQARKNKRDIVLTETDIPVIYFSPEHESYLVQKKALSESQFEMRIYDETGDRLLVWDSKDQLEVQDAHKMFQEYLDKGWRAYAVGDNGKNIKRIFKFDPSTQEIHFDEKKSVKEKLVNFVKTFKEIQMTPRTRPGSDLCLF